MKKRLFSAYHYFRYRVKAVNKHGIHSPFIYSLLNTVIYNKHSYYAYEKIELARKQLKSSIQKVNVYDLGAGADKDLSVVNKSVKQILNKSVKPAKYGQLIFRLVNYFQPKNSLELGTSLGITSCYIAAAKTNSTVYTIEGSESIANVAEEQRAFLPYKNISQLIGNFDTILPQAIEKLDSIDLVFFDGNHRKIPTLNYFNQCLTKSHQKSVFIFDDIYWSKEMKEAWEIIKNNDRVTVSIDLFYMGIVFFHTEQVKQHFIIHF
ncbi:MAG: class I SAM-dependent methyltransferase [Bacteroidia bacterium]